MKQYDTFIIQLKIALKFPVLAQSIFAEDIMPISENNPLASIQPRRIGKAESHTVSRRKVMTRLGEQGPVLQFVPAPSAHLTNRSRVSRCSHIGYMVRCRMCPRSSNLMKGASFSLWLTSDSDIRALALTGSRRRPPNLVVTPARSLLANFLETPLISSTMSFHSLPGLLAALSRDEVRGYPAQRPHQRAAWHMFMVQLSALALWTAGQEDFPQDEAAWHDLLLALTDGDVGPWELTGPDDKPAFLQPAAPFGLNWTDVATPDALDLLITSRNHDLKQNIAMTARPEDWIFALVSLQTSEGYGGAGNNGIARMNGGSSSRTLLGIAPERPGSGGPDPSDWWRRDVERLLAMRNSKAEVTPCTPGGAALLWQIAWPEDRQLDMTSLDPWFIEVCRRVRLDLHDGRISARRSTSRTARIDAKAFKGATGDPWAPITTEDPPKSLTLGEGDFTYKRLSELLFSTEWHLPPLATLGPGDKDCLLVAEALSRGNSKTDGLKSRVIPIPGKVRALFETETAGTLARDQIDEIRVFDEALRNALALVSARGNQEGVGKPQYARSSEARTRFDRTADALFFPALWDRLAATTIEGPSGQQTARCRFVQELFRAAIAELKTAFPTIPCAAIYRPRAEARATRVFHSRIRFGVKGAPFLFLYRKDTADVGQ